jgi:CheY-like chemotaxis protein
MATADPTAEDAHGPPVVLVVEDREAALDLRTGAFDDAGCTTVGVRSHDDALRELRACPGIDLVVTDIHLTKQPNDKSGVALARFVKTTYHDLPVAGYSAVFADDDLSQRDEEPFDYIWPKGKMGPDQIDEMVDRCRESAIKHRLQRAETAFELHSLLRRRHEVAHPEVALLRELMLRGGEAAPVEAALRRAGYRLRLVDANVAGLAKPTVVWLLSVDGGVEAEVYGQPALYALGTDDAAAIADVVELMHLYGAEVGADSPAAVGPALNLTQFLRRMLDNEGGQE